MPMLTTVSTPASRACSTAQPASSSISRWQWESMSVMGSDDGRRGRGGQGVAQLRRHGATASAAGLDTREERRAHDHRSGREAGPGRLLEQQVGGAMRLAEAAQDLFGGARDDRVDDQRHEAQAGRQPVQYLSLIHISEPTRRTPISYAVFCLKKKKYLT